ncbi:flavodoxin family protein [Streptomyces roseirectus]|uniref:Flavodoxin family protein n=1 Tax=Streptomyces roseirectus TaxID=2768066 RepID=A0A7H0IN68_9ACTN|nr:flavodoxin family protein [Streptomyces roseirectus]QNP74234.1 flavodoxin family protein [Streptomyces roseirectus]
MHRTPRVAVIHYSRNGTVHALARAAAAGAEADGAQVRLLRVGGEHGTAPVHEDLLWADGMVLATPTYFGNIASPLKQFIEAASPLWREGALADRVVTGITTSNSPHGGRETTLLALYQSMYHWGALILPAGTTDGAFTAAGGNPYGVAAPADPDGVTDTVHQRAAQALGARLSRACARMARPPSGPLGPGGPSRVAVVCDPTEPGTRTLASALAEGAEKAGAEVRLLHTGSPHGATPADVEWADAVALGGPAFLGGLSPLLTRFLADCEPLRASGKLDGKAATGFVTAPQPHSGSESALLALYHAMHHWGAVIVPPGYTDPSITIAGGNPYGISHTTAHGPLPGRDVLAAAVFQGARLARVTARLRGPHHPDPVVRREPARPPAVR